MKVPKSSLSLALHGNDNDHSFSEPFVLTALACPESQGAWALVPSLFGELLASCKKKSPGVSCASFVPLGTLLLLLVLMRINVRSVLALSFCISSLISSHISDFISSFSSRSLFFFLCLLPFFLVFFFFFFFLFISLSLPVSLHLFLSWPVLNMGATLLSHFVFRNEYVMKASAAPRCPQKDSCSDRAHLK